ncbi:hypothetical protein [Domibacillus indicus]|uniref:hypothetical protein n=1 Tax=Domibacillus indicus TaxID=1437523 RepID=UPI000617F2B5|nr:hypothetical protein [Domibacillus indicus]
MNPIGIIIRSTTGGLVGGAAGASTLTGIGLVVGGGPIAAIGFGIGTIAGTTIGASMEKNLSGKKEGDR